MDTKKRSNTTKTVTGVVGGVIGAAAALAIVRRDETGKLKEKAGTAGEKLQGLKGKTVNASKQFTNRFRKTDEPSTQDNEAETGNALPESAANTDETASTSDTETEVKTGLTNDDDTTVS